ncbi:MAG TPA: CheR family methyltransferase, partial [Ideonella sp.]|nr:CheR family methyltransferase [Ideonella sp.]
MSVAGATPLQRLVAERLGLQFDETRLPLLAELQRRHGGSQAQAQAAWLERLAHCATDSGPWLELAQDLTVTETSFLRYPEQFDAFAEQALPARLAALAPGQSLRILSAGCASGDEPYSLAMVVHERCPQALGRMSLRAVDVNAAALARARAGRYTAWSLRQLPAPLRERWFRPIAGAGGDFLLDRALREAVRFEWHNLADEDRQLWQDGAWDIVFCRNMMMYFTPERMHALVQRIERSLAPGGYLFLGHAETLRGLPSALRLCHSHGCFYYQREPVPAAPPMGSAWQPGPAASPPASLGAAAAIDPHWVDTVQQAHSRIGALAASARELAGTPPRATDLGPAYEALRAERFD